MNEATQIVHWPGKDTPACDEHAAKLKALGAHMGCAVSSTMIVLTEFVGAKCKNCENEEKKRAGKT